MFFDKVKSLGIDSCLYEIPKNDLVDDMSCGLWPSVTFPDVYSYFIETPGDFTAWGKAESIQLCDFGVGQATTGGEAQFWLR